MVWHNYWIAPNNNKLPINNKLSELNERLNSEVAAYREDVLSNRCSLKFCNIQRKTPVLESFVKKVVGLQLSYEYSEIFKSPQVAASEKFIIFSGKHYWRQGRREEKYHQISQKFLSLMTSQIMTSHRC